MNTKKIIQKLITFGITIVILVGCSKDRLERDSYSSMDAFHNKYQQQEQDYQIDSGGTGCPNVICKYGTKICIGADIFLNPNSTPVYYPFHIRVIEIYPVKDIILNKVPNVAGGIILESAAEIRVRALKNNQELILKPSMKYYMELDTMNNPSNYTQVYDSLYNANYIDWTLDGVSTVGANQYFDTLLVGKMGWIDCAKVHASGSKTAITIVPPNGVSGTQFIDVYIVFNNFKKSVMQVYNLTSGQVPIGESVTIIAMAMNQNNDYVYDKQTVTVTAGQQINLNMQVISEQDLLTTLEGL